METRDLALSGTRILCVDDCPEVLKLLDIYLSKEGAEITICSSGEDAIKALKKEHFDVLISDLTMPPGIDGYDLVHELRRLENANLDRKAIPTVMLSGEAMLPSRKRSFADFQVYMPKPFNQARLLHVVERLAEAATEAVKLGSLGSWEALQATDAAVVATEVAATATDAAAEATLAAVDATTAALDATKAAATATKVAAKAELDASAASANAPRERR